jgi:hypothetical protein
MTPYRGIMGRLVPLAALAAFVGCAPTYPQQQNTATSATSGIVTPWGPTLQASPAAQHGMAAPTATAPSATTPAPVSITNDTSMPGPSAHGSGIPLSPAQQIELDEARIALGILDRMANRCLTEADAASCTTLQVNWPNLSRQLRQSLRAISGQDFVDPIVPQTNNSFPVTSPQMGYVPRRPSATAPQTAPSMEKEIPLTPGG